MLRLLLIWTIEFDRISDTYTKIAQMYTKLIDLL